MGLWAKIKQKLGIGGVKLNLEVSKQVPKDSGQIMGAVNVTSKSDQHVKQLNFKLIEKYTTGRGDNKKTKEFELGKTAYGQPFQIKKGENRRIDFVLPFELIKSTNDRLKEKGGALGALGSASSFLGGEKSEYEVWVDADVKGTTFGPNDYKGVQLV